MTKDKKKENSIFVDSSGYKEVRVAILKNNKLFDYDIESSLHKNKVKGNVYVGEVIKIAKAINAVFVNYGKNKSGFLAIDDIHEKYYTDKNIKFPKIGQKVVVQIIKEERDRKGAMLSTYITLTGKYIVVIYNAKVADIGISRKITNSDDRSALQDMIAESKLPENASVIMRTACLSCKPIDIRRDVRIINKTIKEIENGSKLAIGSCLYREYNLVDRVVRDWIKPDITAVYFNNKETLDKATAVAKNIAPSYRKKLILFEGDDMFKQHNIEEQINDIYSDKVLLPSGGYLVFGYTEACTVIDVNSGKAIAEDSTPIVINTEAVLEIARLIKLRDIAGIIIIDFINMDDKEKNKTIENHMSRLMKEESVRIKLSDISQFGIMQISRQRNDKKYVGNILKKCHNCNGSGKVRGLEDSANGVMRDVLKTYKAHKNVYKITVVLNNRELLYHMQNFCRKMITEYENNYNVNITIESGAIYSVNAFYQDKK